MSAVVSPQQSSRPVLPVLGAISLCHFINDLIQSLLPAVYPILKGGFDLSFAQIGLLTFIYQATASLLQPVVGAFTDKHPMPYSLPVGMLFSLSGMATIGFAPSYSVLLAGSCLLGIGSSIFHPESSRIARLASGGRPGFAQSLFQVGGNFGTSIGPLLAAYFVLPRGRASLAWFTLVALTGAVILTAIGRWYQSTSHLRGGRRRLTPSQAHPYANVGRAIAVLIALIFSKFFYMASITSYYIFYLMDHFHVSQQVGQVCLSVFLASTAAGLIVGGMLGDRFGRKAVIWGSIVGVVPFTLLLPHVSLGWTIGLSIVIGLVLSSAMPAIIVYAQELMPGRLGMVSGLFFGLAFGMGGIGAAALGVLADYTSIEFVYQVCAFLPLIGMLAWFLPDTHKRRIETPSRDAVLSISK